MLASCCFAFFMDFHFIEFHYIQWVYMSWGTESSYFSCFKAQCHALGCMFFSLCPGVRWPSDLGLWFWRKFLNNHALMGREKSYPTPESAFKDQYHLWTPNCCKTEPSGQMERPEQAVYKEGSAIRRSGHRPVAARQEAAGGGAGTLLPTRVACQRHLHHFSPVAGSGHTRAPWSEIGVSWETEQVGEKMSFRGRVREKDCKQEGTEKCPLHTWDSNSRLQWFKETDRDRASKEQALRGATGERGEAWVGEQASVEAAGSSLPLTYPVNGACSSEGICLCSVWFPSLQQSLKTPIQQSTKNSGKR